ncbi:MAG: hypothetical protein J6T62_12930, partial [Fibrobacter sp.]|nr:hypothetical protein [Fibrobacter sp.]
FDFAGKSTPRTHQSIKKSVNTPVFSVNVRLPYEPENLAVIDSAREWMRVYRLLLSGGKRPVNPNLLVL